MVGDPTRRMRLDPSRERTRMDASTKRGLATALAVSDAIVATESSVISSPNEMVVGVGMVLLFNS